MVSFSSAESSLVIAGTGLGLLGYALWAMLDLPPVAHRWFAELAASSLGTLALVFSLSLAAIVGAPLGFPGWTAYPGWLLTMSGALLLAFSVFIEIPWRGQPRRRSVDPSAKSGQMDGCRSWRPAGTGRLYSAGTYALCRHPGFLWMLVFVAGTVMVSPRSGMLLLAVSWTVLDLLLVTVQDFLLLPRRFPGYPGYRQSTPFLLPTPASLRRALSQRSESDANAPPFDQRFDTQR